MVGTTPNKVNAAAVIHQHNLTGRHMKKNYLKPTIHVVPLQLSHIICGSDDVINPGTPNTPAGARSRNTYWEWEEEW